MTGISATNVGSVSFDILSNSGAFTKQVKSAGNSAQNIMGGSMKKVGAAVAAAFSVKVVTAFAKECVELGSDLAEVQNVVDVTFGDSAPKINAWAKTTANAFGISELHAKQFSGTMGAMFKSMGLGTDSAYDMSTSLTELAGDIASFYNLDVETAFEKIRSGISGEIMPLRQLGINMSVANLEAYALSQGITQSYNSMTQANQALLRYNYLMSVTADAQGDFSRTSDSWANQTKILKLQFDSLKATLGEVIIQVLTPLLQILNRIMAAANKAATAIAALFGKKADTAGAFSSTNDAAADAADSISGTGDAATAAAKKVKRAFAGFDEINVLAFGMDSSSAGSSGGGASAGADIAESSDIASQGVSETEKKLDSLKNKLQNLWKGFASGFESEKKALLKNIADLKTNAKKTWTDIKSLGTPLKEWASTDLITYFTTYSHVIAGVFLGLFESVNMVWGDIWNVAAFPIIQKFVIDGLPMLTQFKTESLLLFETLFNSVKEISDEVWTGGVVPALTVVSGIFTDLMNTFSGNRPRSGAPVFDGIKKAFTSTKDIILSVWTNHIEPCWNALMSAVDELWKEHLKPLIDEIAEFTAEFTVMATNIYNNFIAPVVLWLQEKLFPVFNRVFNNILNVVKPIVAGIVDSVSGVITTLKGIVQFISGVFSGDWNKAWTGIKNIFSGIWESLSSIIKIPLDITGSLIENFANDCAAFINSLLEGFNSGINAARDFFNGVKETISNIVSKFKDITQYIKGVFSGDWKKAWVDVKNVFSGIWQSISSALKTPINAIFAMIENLVNRCISCINSLIRGFNSIRWNVPDWVPKLGGKSLGFNIKQISQVTIPRLAEGGWVRANNPQLAIVGDNRREGEIIAPESKITEAVEKAKNIAREVKLMIEVVVNYPDGRRIIKQINQAQLEEGKILLEV